MSNLNGWIPLFDKYVGFIAKTECHNKHLIEYDSTFLKSCLASQVVCYIYLAGVILNNLTSVVGRQDKGLDLFLIGLFSYLDYELLLNGSLENNIFGFPP